MLRARVLRMVVAPAVSARPSVLTTNHPASEARDFISLRRTVLPTPRSPVRTMPRDAVPAAVRRMTTSKASSSEVWAGQGWTQQAIGDRFAVAQSVISELLWTVPVSYTHLRAHETVLDLV